MEVSPFELLFGFDCACRLSLDCKLETVEHPSIPPPAARSQHISSKLGACCGGRSCLDGV
jgi:hypothetical protein